MVFFPNIPNVLGVPPLPRLPNAVAAVVDLLVADALSLLGLGSTTQWGLYLDGLPVVVAESVVSFEFKQGYTIANFPVEGGKFESYDKVQRPFDVRLRFATGGTAADRQQLLDSAREAVASLDLMDAVTPEATYESVNPTHFDYRRTSVNGVGLIVVDLFCEQVRSTANSTFTSSQAATTSSGVDAGGTTTVISVRPVASIVNPKSPSASPMVNVGTVQPIPTQQAVVDSVLAQSSLPF